jgi:hypothetical protein
MCFSGITHLCEKNLVFVYTKKYYLCTDQSSSKKQKDSVMDHQPKTIPEGSLDWDIKV